MPKHLKVFENRSKLRASKECNYVLNEVGKYISDLASKVKPEDLLAFEALVNGSVGLAFSIHRLKLYVDSKDRT